MVPSARNLISSLTLILGFSLTACSLQHKTPAAMTVPQMPAMQKVKQGDKVRIILASDQLFEFNSPQLKNSAKPILNQVAATLRDYPNTPIEIAGYADTLMGSKNAQFLSQQQARSVLTYLWVQGFNAEHLYAVGYGDKYPVAFNDTPAGAAANRRIEINLRQTCH